MALMAESLQVAMPSVDILSEAATTAGSGTSRASSPSLPLGQEPRCRVIVKGTFIELIDTPSKVETRRKLGRSKTDSLCAIKSDFEMYEPGRFSDDVQRQEQETAEPTPETVPLQLQSSIVYIGLQPQPVFKPVEPTPKLQTERKSKKARTTLMLRNLPNNYTRDMLLQMLDSQGFSGYYDFVYLPCDFNRNANLGYCFVNLVSEDCVRAFWNTFDNFTGWVLPTAKICQVSWSGPHQGLKAHVDRYKNSPVMHQSVPDEYKPVLFSNGIRKPFPPPSRKIKPPKA